MPSTIERPAAHETISPTDPRMFPTLTAAELDTVRGLGREQHLADGDVAIAAGDADIDFVVCLRGGLTAFNPYDPDHPIITHGPGQFAGDIDLLTRRPVLFTMVAAGDTTVCRVPGDKFRRLLVTVPQLSQKLLDAFTARREGLAASGHQVGAKVYGPPGCLGTTSVREFLYKNFVPASWVDSTDPANEPDLTRVSPEHKWPVVVPGPGRSLVRPTLTDLAKSVGIIRACPIGPFDVAIVGAGPAGLSAAVYAASEGLKTIVLDTVGPGGQAAGSSRIENFLGFPSGLTGTDLATRAVLQLLKFGSQLAVPFTVQTVELGDEYHQLHMDCGTALSARVVLAATGVRWRKLACPGADRFERAGVYYACTVIEAEENRGHDVCVVGGGNSAGQAAMFLAEQCGQTVHVILRGPDLTKSMSTYLSDGLRATANVKVHTDTCVAEVYGDRRLTGVALADRDGGNRRDVTCSAVFTFIGSEPCTSWMPAAVARDAKGFVLTGSELGDRWPVTDRPPCPLETSVPRLLAAGDLRAGSTKRVGFAVGDGSLACTCVHTLMGVRA